MNRGRRGKVRQAMHLANANALVWAFGNGLASTALVIYLALEFGAKGIEVSLILSAPRFAGILRLAAPMLMSTGQARKLLCIGSYLASTLALAAMIMLSAPQENRSQAASVAILVTGWCIYHLLEYVATVALWSWLGDWMPPPVRGRLIGWRERFLKGGVILGLGVSVLMAMLWSRIDPDVPKWVPLFWSALFGAKIMLLSVVPLCWLGAIKGSLSSKTEDNWASVRRAIFDPGYRKLLAYSCWLSFANGISSSAQSIYPWRVLGFSFYTRKGLDAIPLAGQTVIAPWSGWWIDRFGTRGLMTICQLTVATGPLFYLMATPQQPWWIVGAFIVWIMYAPLNVGLDKLKLKLAPEGRTGPSIAVYYALSDLAFGVSAVISGAFYDKLAAGGLQLGWLFATFFMLSWLFRSAAAWFIWRIRE